MRLFNGQQGARMGHAGGVHREMVIGHGQAIDKSAAHSKLEHESNDINPCMAAASPMAASSEGSGLAMDELHLMNLITLTAANHGCRILDIDLQNQFVNLDGPEDKLAECAQAIAELVDA